MWIHLPQREQVAETFQVGGLDLPWMPMSLAPSGTVDALLSLIPRPRCSWPVCRLTSAAAAALTLVVIAVALLGTVLSAAQVAAGEASGLRFYAVTNVDSGGGIFRQP